MARRIPHLLLLALSASMVAPTGALAAGSVWVDEAFDVNRDVTNVNYAEDYDEVIFGWNLYSGGPDPISSLQLSFSMPDPTVSESWTIDGVAPAAACASVTSSTAALTCELTDVAVGRRIEVRRTARVLFTPSYGHRTELTAVADGGTPVANNGSVHQDSQTNDDPPVCAADARLTAQLGDPLVSAGISCTDPEGFVVRYEAIETRWNDGYEDDNIVWRPFSPLAAFAGSTIQWSPPALATGGGFQLRYRAGTDPYPPTGAAGASVEREIEGAVVAPVQVAVELHLPQLVGGTPSGSDSYASYGVKVTNTGSVALPAGLRIRLESPPYLRLDHCCTLAEPLQPGHSLTRDRQTYSYGLAAKEYPATVSAFAESPFASGPTVNSTTPNARVEVIATPHRPRTLRRPRVAGPVYAGGLVSCTPGSFSPPIPRPRYRWGVQGFADGVPGRWVRLHPLMAGMRIGCSMSGESRWGDGVASSNLAYVRAPRSFRSSNRADIYVGDRRRNVVSMGRGNDAVSMGPGNDVVDLGPGNDLALGGPGNDTITCGSGRDQVDAGPGHDVIRCRDGRGDDLIICGTGRDTIEADPGDRQSGCERGRARAAGARAGRRLSAAWSRLHRAELRRAGIAVTPAARRDHA